MEGDPKPGALMGRMSFRREPVHAQASRVRELCTRPLNTRCVGPRTCATPRRSFNVETEKLNAAAEAELARRRADASGAHTQRTGVPLAVCGVDSASSSALTRALLFASGASAGTSVTDEQMAQRLAGKGTKHAAAAAAPEDAQAAKRQKGGGGGSSSDARRGEDAAGAAGCGFQKPAAFDGGRFFSPQQQKQAPPHKKTPKGGDK
jgi:hypothetical protein